MAAVMERGDDLLAIVTVDDDCAAEVTMIPDLVRGDPAFGVTSVNLAIEDLVRRPPPG